MRSIFAFLAVFLLTAAAPALAQGGRIGLHVTVFTMGDHIRLHFHTDLPVTEIAMDDREKDETTEAQLRSVRQRQWRSAPGMLPYDGKVARRDRLAFQDADLDVFPDDLSILWGDPIVFRSGGGFIINSRYLLADPQRFDTIMVFRPRERETMYMNGAGAPALEQRDFHHEFYLGPVASLSGDPHLRLITGNDVPGWARARVGAQTASAVNFFQAKLGPLPWPPTLIMAALPEPVEKPQPRMLGRATPGGVLTFRFFGDTTLSDTESGRAELEDIASHEVFHFWDAFVGRPRDGAEASWLFEGAANYGSMLARRELGQLDASRGRREIDKQLASCRTFLGSKGLGELEGEEHHEAVYSCGMTIEWISDVAIQHARHVPSGFFELWRGLLARAKAQGGFYQLADFRAILNAADPAALATVDTLFAADPAGDRWNKLRRQMESYGVRTGPAPMGEREALYPLFQHLVQADCASPGRFQLFREAAGIRMALEQGSCRHFGPSTEVRAIEGWSLRLDVYNAYAAMTQKCASGLPVTVTLVKGGAIPIACSRPVPPLADRKSVV